ncbi:MAG: sporulation protein [Methylomonas sp.]|nr:MAG: sporulation protein [Methylomonas sp.]PPD26423.1 MAG: sporulation protein [Methylomonas sp.]PPD38172.1 MAG: sporulation protein [Methylomonas sp.]PPD41840.1 MAG: sporulation protein [Methylomonas sp.]PPD51600.1 MAG: sporulation protein [Methylomonas sp.]
MARDYKHRVRNPDGYASNRRRPAQKPAVWWRWLLVIALVVAFIFFLNMIRTMLPQLLTNQPADSSAKTAAPSTQSLPIQAVKPPITAEKPAEPAPVPEEPRYDFYTILPQAETVIPDYEIKSRVREQLVGKTKTTQYVMQAGSFRESAEAERHKAKLALLGIEARVEKAKVGNVLWHRVKIGPYDNPSSVATIKELLQKNGIGVIVTETGQ